jgi:hypothetical protein
LENKQVQSIEWRAPWEAVKDQSLVSELEKELGADHVLFGKKVTALGRRTDSDNVLFHVLGISKPFAVVHLTWNGRESSSKWPFAEFFNRIEDCFDLE